MELPNGLVLLLFENHRLPIFEAQVALRQANLLQPDDKLGVAVLTGRMLDEGTAKRTGPQITAAIENVGGTLALGAGTSLVRVLAPDRKVGLELLLECLTQPSFPADAFARAQARLLAEIGESETLPNTRARQAFRALAYGKSPLGRPATGTTKTVAGLTPADCVAFHRKVFVPNNAIVALVGDFDSQAVLAEMTRLDGRLEEGGPEASRAAGPGKTEGVHAEDPDDAGGVAIEHLPGGGGRAANEPGLLQAAGDGLHPGHGGGLHGSAVEPAARPRGAGVHGVGEHHLDGVESSRGCSPATSARSRRTSRR